MVIRIKSIIRTNKNKHKNKKQTESKKKEEERESKRLRAKTERPGTVGGRKREVCREGRYERCEVQTAYTNSDKVGRETGREEIPARWCGDK